MALATICPHCNTTFRVASDQLKLRGGIVRCGACGEVFDGNAALVDLDAVPAPPPPPAEVLPAPAPSASDAFDAEIAAIDAKEAAEAEEPVYTLDFDTTFDPFGIVPEPVKPEPEPEPTAPTVSGSGPADLTPSSSLPVDEELTALPPPDDAPPHLETEPPAPPPAQLLMRASAAAAPLPAAVPDAEVAIAKSVRRHNAKRKPPEPIVFSPEPVVPDAEFAVEEPEFVRRSRLREETGRTRGMIMAAGSALLLLALAAQGVTTFRNVLAARYPQTRPMLTTACAVFGCKVELPAQIDELSVETGELQPVNATTFSYVTLLRNQSGLAQAWPHLELTLTDANDKALVRRVIAPVNYLPPAIAAKGFAPRSEQPVKVFFELTQVKASGYHIAIFYP
ncbi:zinc-ribbon and DUF3426 domain-containing protein [Massilia sp. R2A-15]|uniref:zinc-ribbon and DUF3426 domain-containing protein n=1 Tax=Massilia sp. R2A-15 TaxID=3064278 RepID=UPI0027329AF6|nr:zinc-ribbon and DUF3426 domain-containing protein [Massilia sp. R2A-15]WLI88419.1 zinc-ribbon and DUF3426 domain-containing protein [Massilia sp. R2A-15]